MNNKKYLSQRAFARKIGVSSAAVSKESREGRVHETSKGINPDHPLNIEYAREALDYQRRQNGEKVNGHKEPVHNPAKIQHGQNTTKSNLKSSRVKAAVEPALDENELKPEDFVGIDDIDLDDFDFDPAVLADLSKLSKPSAEKLKTIEQVKMLQLKREKERKELVSRKSVITVFSKMYMIDTNELIPLAGKLAPRVAALCGVEDSDIHLQIAEMIESEIYQTLGHIKRILNDFLKEIEAEELKDAE